jgi:hypothetical protein
MVASYTMFRSGRRGREPVITVDPERPTCASTTRDGALRRVVTLIVVCLVAGLITMLPSHALALAGPIWLSGMYDAADSDALMGIAEQPAVTEAPPDVEPGPARPRPGGSTPIEVARLTGRATTGRGPPPASETLPRYLPALYGQTSGGHALVFVSARMSALRRSQVWGPASDPTRGPP